MVGFLEIATLATVLIMTIKLPLPNPRPLDESGTLFPYVFVADDAFPLRYNVVKAYAETNLDVRKLIANYRISRARRIIENGDNMTKIAIVHQDLLIMRLMVDK